MEIIPPLYLHGSRLLLLSVHTKPNHMSDPNTTGKRPTLLTVLCILTFVFGGIGLISGLMGLAKNPQADLDAARAQMEEAMAQAGGDAPAIMTTMLNDSIAMLEKQAANHWPITIVGLICTLLSLYGAWKMWNLQKQGFTFYVLGTLISLLSTFYFLGFSMTILLGAGLVGLISLVFILLYASQLKHMH